MWIYKHHAIVVTGKEPEIHEAHKIARKIPLAISGMVFTANNHVSFFIAPDGTGENGAGSEAGDEKRKLFRHKMERLEVVCVEVQYGCAQGGTDIIIY